MITTDDIETVVKAALDAQTAFGTGKSWPNRGPDDPDAYPYVVFSLSAGEAMYDSGPKYHQYWRVRAAAYCQLGSTPALPAIMKDLHTALVVPEEGRKAGQSPVAVALRNEGESVLHSYLKYSEEEYDETLRDGRDVLVATLECELLCLGLNSVS